MVDGEGYLVILLKKESFLLEGLSPNKKDSLTKRILSIRLMVVIIVFKI